VIGEVVPWIALEKGEALRRVGEPFMAIGKVLMYCCLTPRTLAQLTELIGDLRSLIEVDGYRSSELARALGVDRRKAGRSPLISARVQNRFAG
jgi:hypothetical protein